MLVPVNRGLNTKHEEHPPPKLNIHPLPPHHEAPPPVHHDVAPPPIPHNVAGPPVIDAPKPNSPKKNNRRLEDLNIAIDEAGGDKEGDDELEMPVPDQTDRKELLQQLEEQKVCCHGNIVLVGLRTMQHST